MTFHPATRDAVANATWWPALPSKEQLLRSVHSTPVWGGVVGLTEPRGFRDVQRWVWLFHISSLPQTSIFQQKPQLQALSAHISSFDLEQMQKNSFSRWWSTRYLQPSAPQLHIKVVFTQQIKRRLRLKTYFISTVIIVIKILGFKSKYGHKREFTCHLKLDKDPASCTKYVESTCKATWNSLTFVTFCCVEWWCDCAVVMVRISWS